MHPARRLRAIAGVVHPPREFLRQVWPAWERMSRESRRETALAFCASRLGPYHQSRGLLGSLSGKLARHLIAEGCVLLGLVVDEEFSTVDGVGKGPLAMTELRAEVTAAGESWTASQSGAQACLLGECSQLIRSACRIHGGSLGSCGRQAQLRRGQRLQLPH